MNKKLSEFTNKELAEEILFRMNTLLKPEYKELIKEQYELENGGKTK